VAAGVGCDRRRKRARDRRNGSIKRKLAEHRKAGQRVRRHGPDRGHQAERDRQVEMAAFLGKVGGGEIDGDAARRQREAGGDQRRPHPLARLGHRLVGQPDDREGRHAGHDLHLHVDGPRLDAFERHRRHPNDHDDPRAGRFRLAQPMIAAAQRPSRTLCEH
jgi:hypothetical protein